MTEILLTAAKLTERATIYQSDVRERPRNTGVRIEATYLYISMISADSGISDFQAEGVCMQIQARVRACWP